MLQPELLLIVLAAVAPAVVAGVVLVVVARPRGAAWIGGLVAFVWGAVVATSVASLLNDAAAAALAGDARTAALVPAIVGPVIEELVKAAGFVAVALVPPYLATQTLGGVREAIAIGALIGFGFAVAENVSYYLLAAVQGGYDALGRAVYLRGVVQSGNHAVFTATAGAALGWARTRTADVRARAVVVALGLLAAIVLHAIWNGAVSRAITTVLCNAPVGSEVCAPAPDAGDLLLAVPALEAAFLIPIVAALRRVARPTA